LLPSIRLKNLRRGIEDAGYLQLARASHREEASAIARALLPRILAEAVPGEPPAWSEHGAAFFAARRALARFVADGGVDPGPPAGVGVRPHRPAELVLGWRGGGGLRWRYLIGIPGALLVAATVLAKTRRRGVSP
jgi:hypothetical protein